MMTAFNDPASALFSDQFDFCHTRSTGTYMAASADPINIFTVEGASLASFVIQDSSAVTVTSSYKLVAIFN